MSESIKDEPGSEYVCPTITVRGVIYRTGCRLDGSYAAVEDVDLLSIAENAQNDFSTQLKCSMLVVASRFADSFVGQRWEAPLKAWSEAWVFAICELAYTSMVARRGYPPKLGSVDVIVGRRKEALDWVKAAQSYDVTPDPRLVNEEPYHVANMDSAPPRGWSGFGPGSRCGGRGGGGGFFGSGNGL